MKKYGIISLICLLPILAFAQVATPDVPVGDFLGQVFTSIKQLGGGPWALKIAVIVNIVIASMKVTVLRNLIWDKLGGFQILVAPVLGLVAAVITYLASGVALTLPNMVAFVMTGAGAIILHELMDALKTLPWFGAKYVAMIESLMDSLGAKKA